MATISTLAVNLIARTSAFEKGMGRSRKSVRGFQSSTKKALATVASFARGLAVAAGVGGMGFMLKRTLSTIDATAKLSDRIGIATEKLIGLRHAAGIAGVSSEQLDKALEIFVRRMGEVKSGSGEATRGLEALGLSAEEMIQKTPDEALLIISERIKNLGTQAEKSAAAYFLFGRAGAQLLNMFEDGADGMKKMQIQAEALGLTFSRIDAAKVEAANDAITRLKASLTGVVNEITIRLAPAIKNISNFLTKNRDVIVGVIGKMTLYITTSFLVVKAIKVVKAVVLGLAAAYKFLTTARIAALAFTGPAGWIAIAASVAVATGAIIAFNEVIDVAAEKMQGISEVKPAADAQKFESILELSTEIEKRQKRIARIKKDEWGWVDASLETRKKELAVLMNQRAVLVQRKNIEDAIAKRAGDAKARIEFEDTVFGGLDKFLDDLANKIDEVGLDDFNKKLLELERTGEGLSSIAFAEFARGLDEAALGGLDLFIANITDKIDNIGVSDLDKQLLQLQKTGEGLTGGALDIFNEGFKDAIALVDILKEKQDKLSLRELTRGRFQEIRSEFIDVSALNPNIDKKKELANVAALDTKEDTKKNKQIDLAETANQLLGLLVQNSKGAFLS